MALPQGTPALPLATFRGRCAVAVGARECNAPDPYTGARVMMVGLLPLPFQGATQGTACARPLGSQAVCVAWSEFRQNGVTPRPVRQRIVKEKSQRISAYDKK